MRSRLVILFLCVCLSGFTQMTQEQYIEKYASIAVKEMKRVGVPASITLSQGILESASGNSFLAKQGNNHFGIKCHNWKWDKIYADDDTKNECFRKYNNVEDSYRDHSDFLREHNRYHFLFELEIIDYQGWAKGLKKAGYATNPAYPERLIGLIEKHELYNYDLGKAKPSDKKPNRNNSNKNNYDDGFEINLFADDVLENNRVPYIVTKNNTDINTISQELNLMTWQITKYNDLNKDEIIAANDTIYLKPKRNKASKANDTHLVKSGETMRGISQKYAVKLKKLYQKNNMKQGDEPLPGTKINLRKRVK
ncbi:MAG: glucosaminidase domain-containing protein [Bacteroidales bacterium]|nr:glucosaminidase domain-containing protein [Bacteroidales bacterium]MDD4216420.1 glucosaminidase domain-containing protein [Bacteroidales bacterium]MDY0142586.1 glucosaminidase domain-containing protein [Bacteroidales bacterium]